MADTNIDVSKMTTHGSGAISVGSSVRPEVPVSYTASFIADDSDYHAAVFSGSGKGRFSFCIDNPSNKDFVATLYGSYSSDGEVDDADVFAIDSTGITASATSQAYDTCSDPFPYYIVRLKAAANPDSETVSIFVCFMAY